MYSCCHHFCCCFFVHSFLLQTLFSFFNMNRGADELFSTFLQLLSPFLHTSPLSGGRGMSTTHIITVIVSKSQGVNRRFGPGPTENARHAEEKCLRVWNLSDQAIVMSLWSKRNDTFLPKLLTNSKRQDSSNGDKSLWHLRIWGC